MRHSNTSMVRSRIGNFEVKPHCPQIPVFYHLAASPCLHLFLLAGRSKDLRQRDVISAGLLFLSGSRAIACLDLSCALCVCAHSNIWVNNPRVPLFHFISVPSSHCLSLVLGSLSLSLSRSLSLSLSLSFLLWKAFGA